MKPQEVFTYLLYSKTDNGFYVGITADVKKRLIDHNQGKVVSTQTKRPLILVYYKAHSSYESARKHEKWLKKKDTGYKHKLAQLAPPDIGGVK